MKIIRTVFVLLILCCLMPCQRGSAEAVQNDLAIRKITNIDFREGECVLDTLTELSQDGKLSAAVRAVNTGTQEPYSFILLLAVFDVKGKLKQAYPAEISVPPGSAAYDISVGDMTVNRDHDTVKLYIWESMREIGPCCGVSEITPSGKSIAPLCHRLFE